MKYYIIVYKEKEVGLGNSKHIPPNEGAFSYREITKEQYKLKNKNFWKN